MPWRPEAPRNDNRLTYDKTRPNSGARLYDGVWRKFRDLILRQRPICEDCLQTQQRDRFFLIRPATEVHHIRKVKDRPDLRLVSSNVMALCKAHHSQRTARGE